MLRIITIAFAITVIGLFLIRSTTSQTPYIEVNNKEIYVCTPCNSECDNINYERGGTCSHCQMPLVLKSELESPKKIAFYLQDGVEILDFAGPMEVFAYAGYDVFTFSKTKAPIVSQGILKIVPDYDLTDAPSADILAFFGGNASEAYKDSNLIDWVKSQSNVEYHFSVCTGAFILAESGLLDGLTATTFHNALDELKYNYAEIKVLDNVRFVDNGTVITTAGISAGIDGALHLVAKLDGFNTARKVAYHMEYDKWIPGEGLLLENEGNPYEYYTNQENLKAYEGIYEYLDDLEIELKIDQNTQSLFAIVNGRKYPLFYLETDTVANIDGDLINFSRDKDQKVLGFSSKRYSNQFFSKLD